jgi:2-aminoadipate transaminase
MSERYRDLLSATGRQVHESAIRRMGITAARVPDLVSFAPGYPDASLFPWDDLRAITARVLDGRDPSVLQYGPTRGDEALVEALVPVQRARGIAATPANLLVTTGWYCVRSAKMRISSPEICEEGSTEQWKCRSDRE